MPGEANPLPTFPSHTRVAVCDGDGGLRVGLRQLRSPGRGEVLLRLRCCGLCGTDLFKITNRLTVDNTVLGHELVGDVEAIGEGVVGAELGQRVVVPHHVACGACELCRRGAETKCASFQENLLDPGGFSEYVLVRRRAVERAMWIVPDEVTDAAATFLEPAACVLRGIDRAGLSVPDGWAVVIGAGSMGLLHLLVLRALHPELRVIVSDPIEDRRDLAAKLGAAASCTPELIETEVAELTSGLGADAVFDTVGGNGPLRDGVRVTRLGGTVVLFAHAAEGELAGFELNPFFKGERRLVGTYSSSLREQRRIAEQLSQGLLDPNPLVSHRLPLSRFEDAVAMAVERRALKILLEPGPP
jgi:L-iditol 2-dehydrogenase